MKKFLITIGFIAVASVTMAAQCQPDADVASYNISKAADMFEINRRIVFYNGISGEYMLVLEGRCSLGNFDSQGQLSVTCKTGPQAFKKHFLGLSDNVTYFAEQIDVADVSVYHNRIIWKPQGIIPELDVRGSSEELLKDRY